MSIWSTIGNVDGLYAAGYGPLGEPLPMTSLDLAAARSRYGDTALRVTLEGPDGHACAVLSRSQVATVVQQLQGWLDHPAESQLQGWLDRHDEPEETT